MGTCQVTAKTRFNCDFAVCYKVFSALMIAAKAPSAKHRSSKRSNPRCSDAKTGKDHLHLRLSQHKTGRDYVYRHRLSANTCPHYTIFFATHSHQYAPSCAVQGPKPPPQEKRWSLPWERWKCSKRCIKPKALKASGTLRKPEIHDELIHCMVEVIKDHW